MKESKRRCAVITGATSGIGREFAHALSKLGYYLVVTGRNEEALHKLKKEIGESRCTAVVADLSDTKSCLDFYAAARKYDPVLLINNAGFGLYGNFTETSLTKEIEMIDVNIKAMHILFKLFLTDFVKKDRGYILNVASSAGFMPGPLMATYYSSKSYVVRQTAAVYTELRAMKSRVNVSALCPGPVTTEFNTRAGIKGFAKGITARQCVAYTIREMMKKKLIIIPTVQMKILVTAASLAPIKLASFGGYIAQKGKKKI